MDKADPPMMFTGGTPDKGVHSQLFVDKLVARAKESGASLKIARIVTNCRRSCWLGLGSSRPRTKHRSRPSASHTPLTGVAHPSDRLATIGKLPGGYGFGSSTLAKWIRQNLDKDNKAKSGE